LFFFIHVSYSNIGNPPYAVPTRNSGGVDVRKFEPNLRQIDPFVRKLRKIYKVNPEWFEVPEFALKIY
jgi:hypothetical protein